MPSLHSGAATFRYRELKMVGVLNRPEGPAGRSFPGVLFLHGFPGAEKNVDIQRRLLARGVASFALHFSGAWGSQGFYSFSGLVPQARAALLFLRSRPFVDPGRLGVLGFSMGGWAAINLAALEPSLKAAAAIAPVGGPEMVRQKTRGEIARLCSPLSVRSAASLFRDFVRSMSLYDPHQSVKSLPCPLLLVHGEADEVVPVSVSERLFREARGPRRLLKAAGAGHDFLDRREWLSRRVSDWLLARLQGLEGLQEAHEKLPVLQVDVPA